MIKTKTPAAIGARRASVVVDWQVGEAEDSPSQRSRKVPGALRAELTGSDTASALGITTHGYTPVLALCRELVERGHSPDLPLEAWRGETLCLRVRSIGIAARLEINSKGSDFIKATHAVRTASPVASTGGER